MSAGGAVTPADHGRPTTADRPGPMKEPRGHELAAYELRCPRCDAAPGYLCRDEIDNREKTAVHPARLLTTEGVQ